MNVEKTERKCADSVQLLHRSYAFRIAIGQGDPTNAGQFLDSCGWRYLRFPRSSCGLWTTHLSRITPATWSSRHQPIWQLQHSNLAFVARPRCSLIFCWLSFAVRLQSAALSWHQLTLAALSTHKTPLNTSHKWAKYNCQLQLIDIIIGRFIKVSRYIYDHKMYFRATCGVSFDRARPPPPHTRRTLATINGRTKWTPKNRLCVSSTAVIFAYVRRALLIVVVLSALFVAARVYCVVWPGPAVCYCMKYTFVMICAHCIIYKYV